MPAVLKDRFSRNFKFYALGCLVVWVVILAAAAASSTSHRNTLLVVFGGWALGWISATIGSVVHNDAGHR